MCDVRLDPARRGESVTARRLSCTRGEENTRVHERRGEEITCVHARREGESRLASTARSLEFSRFAVRDTA